MQKHMMVALAFLGVLLSAIAFPLSASAATAEPWEAAEQMRQLMFDAQVALLHGDQTLAETSIMHASDIYTEHFAAEFETEIPLTAHHIQEGLASASTAIKDDNGPALAVARAQVRGGLLEAGALRAISATESGDVQAAREWLLVREFRPTTRFSQASTLATLELRSLELGRVSPEEAAQSLRADLFDTYQALLLQELQDIEAGIENDLLLRQSEAAGMAQAYWRIVAPSFEDQLGLEARQNTDSALDSLIAATETQDQPAQLAAVRQLNDQLRGFRAVRLTNEEQARRANQLLRFLALVPVEYSRGIRNGEVAVDIEIQEAITFLDGSQAALNDLWPELNETSPEALAEIVILFDEMDSALNAANRREAVQDPEVFTANAASAQALLRETFPADWLPAEGDAVFDDISQLLDEMEQAVAAGNRGGAEQIRLEAYAIFDSGPEQRLLGFAPGLVARIDGLFWHGYEGNRGLATAIAKGVTPAELAEIRQPLDAALSEAKTTLNAGSPPTGAVIFNSATIVFREGLEAVLIFSAVMASMVGAYASYRRPLIVGALLAFLVTALTWVVFHFVLGSLRMYGEKLEAVVSLIAIGVLILVLNWFFHNTYWSRWIQGIHGKKRSIMGMAAGQTVSFILLGFTSVYREGFETTLFLQAIVLDAGTLVVLEGVALGLLFTAAVGLLIFALQKKLPHKRLLILTGVLISVVLVTMVGTTVHTLQAVGWMPITPVENFMPPYWAGQWLGIFPTWEGLILQLIAAIFVIGSYFAAEQLKHRERRHRMEAAQQTSD